MSSDPDGGYGSCILLLLTVYKALVSSLMHKILGARLVLDEHGMVYVHYHLRIDEVAEMEYDDPYSWSHLY